jgi:hypothetical protein
MLEELQLSLTKKEKDLQIVNSLISLKNNKDYQTIFDNYLFKDKILEITSKLRFGSEIENGIYLKQLESLTELKLLINGISTQREELQQDIIEIRDMITNYMFNDSNE